MGRLARVLILLFLPLCLHAQDSIFYRRGDDVTLRIAVIGPGNELYFWWGHIGLVVEDNLTGRSWFFDWGVFSFDSDNFFVDFAMGRPTYSCMVSTAESSFNVYFRTNRDIVLYTLDLPPQNKEEVLRFAEINMLPENRDYRYHHFLDNCATRIRDILDIGLEGRLYAHYGEIPSNFTFRQHVRRHTWFNPFFDWLLNFWMGQVIDRPITVWDDMFLPSEIGKLINEFTYIDSLGRERALVSSVEILNTSIGRPAVLDTPRIQWPRNLIASLVFLAALSFFSIKIAGERAFRMTLGLTQALSSLLLGIAGSMLFFMQFFSDHDYTFQNINIIFANPLFLLLVPAGIFIAFHKDEVKRQKAIKYSKFFWAYVFIACLLTVPIKLLPLFYQQNQVTQVMVIPFSLIMVFLLIYLDRRLGKAP
ncbi:MAG: DUF4105 domain-containing protein [Treponema sp.]|nr:DUF4105 domain-containing protein [Treponema sp.]